MSQWGAYGAATKGLTHQQILAFYYPGTTLAQATSSGLRIKISGVSSSGLTVLMSTGLQFTSGSTTVTLGATDGGKPVLQWRLVPSAGGGLALQWLVDTTWKTAGSYGNVSGTPSFVNPTSGGVRVARTNGVFREFPDHAQAVRSGSTVVTVNATTMEKYLRGVVPNEMPASWLPAALRTQAVAARTYATYEKQHSSSTSSDVCDTTSCQVYDGLADYSSSGTLLATHTHPNADAAITATSGVLVMYGGTAAFTQFSAANGGWMSAGTVPYLVAKADPYDGVIPNNAHSWTVSSTSLRTTLENARPAIGTLRSIIVTRDGNGEWGGRIRGVSLVGSTGTAPMGWDTLRSVLGLKSEWFTVTNGDFLRKDTSGDGKPDVYGRSTDGTLYRLPFMGSALGAATKLGGGWNVMNVLGNGSDLNGDGAAEVLSRDTSGAFWCYPVPASGSMTVRTRVTGVPARTDRLTGIGDVTSDGKSDFLGIDRATGTLWLYVGNGACGYSARTSLGGGWNVMDAIVGAGDTDLDGRADIWARDATTNTLWTYRTDGAGAIKWPRVRVGGGWNVMKDMVALGDVNAGNGADLLGRDTSGALWLYPGTGKGTFGTRTAVSGSVANLTLLR
jgi:SpoIID/LytB domain protein